MQELNKTEQKEFGKLVMQWWGWGSPVGLALGIGVTLNSLGFFLWMLHLAGLL